MNKRNINWDTAQEITVGGIEIIEKINNVGLPNILTQKEIEDLLREENLDPPHVNDKLSEEEVTQLLNTVNPNEVEKDMINPAHYQREGRKQCIEEMEELFGIDACVQFAICNAYKYRYRCGLKDKEDQEMKKVNWYEEFAAARVKECNAFTIKVYNDYWANLSK